MVACRTEIFPQSLLEAFQLKMFDTNLTVSKLRVWLSAKMLHEFLKTWYNCSALWVGTCQLLVIKTKPPKTFSCLKQRKRANIWWLFSFLCCSVDDNSSLPFLVSASLKERGRQKKKSVWGGRTGREDPAARARKAQLLGLKPEAAGLVQN